MSIATIKIELTSRAGRDLLPRFFPIDLLISLTRELALVVDRSLSLEELVELHSTLRTYLRQIIGMQNARWLVYFDGHTNELLADLVEELYGHICDELVSRLIGYNVSKLNLQDRFTKHLEMEPTDTLPVP